MGPGKLIYLRHGHDYRRSRKHDERLTDEGKDESKQMVQNLIDEHGFPNLILHSPYYRCRQTAKIMQKVLSKTYNKNIQRQVDPNLGRYFTRKQKRDPDIKRSTKRKGAIIDESWEEFKERVGDHLIDMEKYQGQMIWLVTHSLVLIRVAKIKGVPYQDWVGYLDTLVIY